MSLFLLKLEPNSMSYPKLLLSFVLLRQEANCKYLFRKSKDLLSNQYVLGISLESKCLKIARHDSRPSGSSWTPRKSSSVYCKGSLCS